MMIVVHGGAGLVTPERHDRLRGGVRAAAQAGANVLGRGGSALDAVVSAVRVLEDDPEFGAGMGSALTRDGTVETCASVMDGARRKAGAVAAVQDLGQPVIVARAALEVGEHVILAGVGAQRYAGEIGLSAAPQGSLVTPRALAAFREAQAKGMRGIANEGGGVGAVACDQQGNLAAATSTGGTVFRRAGCVDDSCVPGIGTWADGEVAISTSGGEALFRVALAKDVAARIAAGEGLRKAVKESLVALKKLVPDDVAGVIAVTKESWVALQLGPAMPTAWVDKFGPNDAIGFEV